MAQTDEKSLGRDMNMPLILTIGIVGAILVFVVVVAIEAWFYAQQSQERQAKSLAVQNQTLVDNRVQQLRALEGYRWVDQGKGVVAIPIDRAIALTATDYAARPAPSPGR
jgi:hypothetical protein